MQKRITFQKRRIKNYFQVLVPFVTLFFITLLLLFLFYKIEKDKQNNIKSPVVVSLKSSTKIDNLQKAINTIRNAKIDVNDVKIASDGAILTTLKDGKEVVFSKDKPIELQVSSLQLIIGRLTIEGKQFNKIDFRFDNPVITF